MEQITFKCGREGESPIVAVFVSEAPPTSTGRKRWWVNAPSKGIHSPLLIKKTHHLRVGKVQAPYEFCEASDGDRPAPPRRVRNLART